MVRTLKGLATFLVLLGLGLAFADKPTVWALACVAVGLSGLVLVQLGESYATHRRLVTAVAEHAYRYTLPYRAEDALADFVRVRVLVTLAGAIILGLGGLSLLWDDSPALLRGALWGMVALVFLGSVLWAPRRLAAEKKAWEAIASCLGLTCSLDRLTYVPTMTGTFRGREVFVGLQRRHWRRGYRCFGSRGLETTCITIAASLSASMTLLHEWRGKKELSSGITRVLAAHPDLQERLTVAMPYLWLTADGTSLKLQWMRVVWDCATLHFLLALACDLATVLENAVRGGGPRDEHEGEDRTS